MFIFSTCVFLFEISSECVSAGNRSTRHAFKFEKPSVLFSCHLMNGRPARYSVCFLVDSLFVGLQRCSKREESALDEKRFYGKNQIELAV